jgi:hypothetical protein
VWYYYSCFDHFDEMKWVATFYLDGIKGDGSIFPIDVDSNGSRSLDGGELVHLLSGRQESEWDLKGNSVIGKNILQQVDIFQNDFQSVRVDGSESLVSRCE